MNHTIFLDSNIVIDYFSRSETYPDSVKIISLANDGKLEAWVSEYVLGEVLTHFKHGKRGYLGKSNLSIEEISELVNEIQKFVSIPNIRLLDSFRDGFSPFESARNSCVDSSDTFILESAIRTKSEYLITRDEKFDRQDIVKNKTPTELIEILTKESTSSAKS